MARYNNPLIQELSAQLVRGPRRLKWKQTIGAEKLFRIVQRGKEYPYDLVTDHITGYRDPNPRVQRPLIAGDDLLHDLPVLIDQVSDAGHLSADEAPGGELLTVEDLSQRFGVSGKTVNRWRRDGLVGRKVRFPDGKTRVAFLPGSVEYFASTRGERVRRGSQFSRLSDEERDQVLRLAGRMAGHGSRQQVIERIARRLGRSVETVRYVVTQWDQAHPTRAIFPDRRRSFTPRQYQQIYDAWRAGEKPADLADRFGCAASTIYRAVNQVRFEEARARKPEWIHNAEFGRRDAEQQILQTPIPEAPAPPKPPRKPARSPDALPYLHDLWGGELLTADQERALFRRYNYLKFRIAGGIDAMDDSGLISGPRLTRIEEMETRCAQVRDRLIKANLRLVVSVAKKHHGPMTQLSDLISDGNVVLMRAIEKFDYGRGQKFSTYCSWAIMKHFARSIPEGNYARRWVGAIEPDAWAGVAGDVRLADFHKPQLDTVREDLQEGLAVLPERERTVLLERFGLEGDGRGKTLTQIGELLGVTKERVRQIEAVALRKLRELLGGELVEQYAEA
jgi:RNA polymerase sigma factor (sigma-70 family)